MKRPRLRPTYAELSASLAEAVARRAAVEDALYQAAAGKRPLPDADECRALARRLGVPDALNTKRGAP